MIMKKCNVCKDIKHEKVVCKDDQNAHRVAYIEHGEVIIEEHFYSTFDNQWYCYYDYGASFPVKLIAKLKL